MRSARATALATLHGVALLLLWTGAVAADREHEHATCPNSETPEIKRDRAALEASPEVLEPRLRLADALSEQGCYEAAVHVLEEGEALHGRNSAWQSALRTAKSLVSEQQYFEGLELAEEAAKTQRNVVRCTRLADIAACDEALAAKPDNAEIMVAKGDALMQANRPAEAERVYRRAAELSPANQAVTAKIAAAADRRARLVKDCETGSGPSAVQACQAALVRGAPDEFSLLRRKAMLLQAAGESSQALDAYIAANSLKEDDQSVALAIVALTDSTNRKDAVALEARGIALFTLGRAGESVLAFKQAQTLAPGMPDLKRRLAAAERVAKRDAERSVQVAALSTKPAAPGAPPERVVPQRTYSNDGPVTRSH